MSRTSLQPRRLVPVLAAAILTVATVRSQAMIVHTFVNGPGTPSPYNAQPADDPGWDNVGWGSFGTAESDPGSAVYLGNGWVLTANHTKGGGITLFTDDPAGGTFFARDPGTALVQFTNPAPGSGLADLVLMKLAANAALNALPALPIAAATPALSDTLVLIGTGVERGSARKIIIDKPGVVDDIYGYDWSTTRNKVWVSGDVALPSAFNANLNTFVFATEFVQTQGFGNAAGKDSGGAAFVFNAGLNRWELAGIVNGLDGYVGQPPGTAAFGTHTFLADLSVYRSQIIAVVPEPASLALVGLGGLLILARPRRGSGAR